MADVKRVYTFGNKAAEGNGKMRELLGGQGANLAEMNLIGIPVPGLYDHDGGSVRSITLTERIRSSSCCAPKWSVR